MPIFEASLVNMSLSIIVVQYELIFHIHQQLGSSREIWQYDARLWYVRVTFFDLIGLIQGGRFQLFISIDVFINLEDNRLNKLLQHQKCTCHVNVAVTLLHDIYRFLPT